MTRPVGWNRRRATGLPGDCARVGARAGRSSRVRHDASGRLPYRLRGAQGVSQPASAREKVPTTRRGLNALRGLAMAAATLGERGTAPAVSEACRKTLAGRPGDSRRHCRSAGSVRGAARKGGPYRDSVVRRSKVRSKVSNGESVRRRVAGGLLSLEGAAIAPRRLPRIDPRIDPTPAEPAATPNREEPLGRTRAERAGVPPIVAPPRR